MQCGASERHACHLADQPRGTQRYKPTQRNDEEALTPAIITLADRYGRYGDRRITIKLREQRSMKSRVQKNWPRHGVFRCAFSTISRFHYPARARRRARS